MLINPFFKIGQIVYLKTDREQLPCVVTRYVISQNDMITYWLCQGKNDIGTFYDYEISDIEDIIMKTSN